MKRYINIYPALDIQREFEVTNDIKYVGYTIYNTKEEADLHAGGGRIGCLEVIENELEHKII